MKMVRKNSVFLFTNQENYVKIVTTIGKRGKIRTYWYAFDRKKILERSKQWDRKNKSLRHKQWIKRKKENQEILHNLKVNGCAICGYNKYDGALEFHHVNPKDKIFPLSADYMGKKTDDMIKELNKCILLCSNCHKEIHGRK